MIQLQAPITDARRVAPGISLLRVQAAEIARRAQAGQFTLVRCSEGSDPYLRRPLPLFTIGPDNIALLVRADEPGRRWLARQSAGQALDMLGPMGQGFTLAPTTSRLLLVAEGMGVASLAALATQATAKGIEVTLLAGAPSAATAIPASLLPSEVEYRLATADGSRGQRGAVAELLPATIQWADQVCAAGSPSLYHALAQSIARYRLRVDDDFAQVWILGTVACGLGVCHSCTVETRHGPVLSCHDGPVFRLKEIEAW